jgi:membrane protein
MKSGGFRKLVQFVKRDVWRIRARDLSRGKGILITTLRTVLLALRGFRNDRCQLRASALTFYSILSIVPVVAMAFGVAKGFGMEERLESRLRDALRGVGGGTVATAPVDPDADASETPAPEAGPTTAPAQAEPTSEPAGAELTTEPVAAAVQTELADRIIEFAKNLLENVKGGLVAGIGFGILLWTVIKVLGNIEKSFNDIWGVKRHRSLARKFTDYISIMLVCPMLLIISGSATVLVTTMITGLLDKLGTPNAVNQLVVFGLKFTPFVLGWLMFAFVYMFMPNTRVKFRSALLAGVLAGTTFQITQWAYIAFQVGVSKYSAVYGSFAALPMFMIWMQLSWLIVLFGAEVSFAHQNVETYEFEPDCLGISHAFRRLLALRIANVYVKNFAEGKPPEVAEGLCHELGVPIRLVNEILDELVQAGILVPTQNENPTDTGYQPARSLDQLTVGFVLDRLEKRGEDNVPIVETSELKTLRACLQDFDEAVQKSPKNVPLREI